MFIGYIGRRLSVELEEFRSQMNFKFEKKKTKILENETTDVTPDTDNDSIEHIQRSLQGSFKRPAPVMGNRSLESRNSKRSQHHPQSTQAKSEQTSGNSFQSNNSIQSKAQPITVGALEVQNVKRAINRYGTLPKGKFESIDSD